MRLHDMSCENTTREALITVVAHGAAYM